MNFRIVLHLLMTDTRRLRWLLLACWIVLLLASWPSLSFSPERFDMPLTQDLIYGGSDSSFRQTLEKEGVFSATEVRVYETLELINIGVMLMVAGCLGFQSRMWTEGRPVRRRESAVAKVSGLLLFLILPLGLLAMIVALVHGVPWGEAAAKGATRAMGNLPALTGVMLFGMLCGLWWSWLGGMFGMALACQVLPPALRLMPGPDWFRSPLKVAESFSYLTLRLWIAAVVLAALIRWVPKHLPATKKVGLAVLAIMGACQFMRYQPLPYYMADTGASLPDWSDRVKPEIEGGILEATIENGVLARGPHMRRTTSFDSEFYMNMVIPLETPGLPANSYASWSPRGISRLRAGDLTVSSTAENDNISRYGAFYGGTLDEAELSALVQPEGQKLKWGSPTTLMDSRMMAEVFTPVNPGAVPSVELEMDLEGGVIQLEKLVDVPFGEAVTVRMDGVDLHIRRLDIEGHMPVADLCWIEPLQAGTGEFRDQINQLNAVIYFPTEGMARLPWSPQLSYSNLAPGLTAVRRLYLTGQSSGSEDDLQGYEDARFMLVRSKRIAKATAEIRTAALPLQVDDNRRGSGGRDSFDPPPHGLRPDPETATPQQFEEWMKRSYSTFDREWGGRNMADYVPRYLEQILRRRGGVHPPSTPEGRAIEIACPESRRREVIDALTQGRRSPDGNWIPDVLIRRGWVDEAKPQLMEMLAKGQVEKNVFSQLAVAMLEDPETYAELLKQEYWFETYQKLRLLPGVEPQLTEAVAEKYRKLKKRKKQGDADSELHLFLAPAAHGMPEALGDLLEQWQKLDPMYHRGRSEYMREVILLPGQPNDWRAVVGALTGRKAADFRYDPLARMWVPIEP